MGGLDGKSYLIGAAQRGDGITSLLGGKKSVLLVGWTYAVFTF